MKRPSSIFSRFACRTKHRLLARSVLALGAASACLLTAPLSASAATATFKYNFEVDPDRALDALDPNYDGLDPDNPWAESAPVPYWALVAMEDSLNDGQFSMQIKTSFNEEVTPEAAITQLAFNLNGYTDSDFPVNFDVLGCVPAAGNAKSAEFCAVPLGQFSMFTGPKNKNSPADNGVGVDGAGLLGNGFDVLLELPTSNPKLSNDQAPITLLIQGPSGFSVARFLAVCSNGSNYDEVDGCDPGSFQTVAKIQSLPGQPDSTVIGGIGANGDTPPGPQEEVPGPLPLLGAATAFGFSRKLRGRIASRQWRRSYAL